MQDLQPFKAPRNLAALAQATAANSEGTNSVFGAQGLVATGAIPNPTSSTAPVVAAFVPFTPRFSGKAAISGSLIPGENANGATQALRTVLQYTTTLPTLAAAPLAPTTIAAGIDVAAGTGMTPATGITSTVSGLTVGTLYYICLCVAQSAAGAFALAATLGDGIRVTETPNG